MSDKFKFGDPSLPSHCLCHYCGLSHRTVEAGGIWYCPNPGCGGPGNNYLLSSLPETKNHTDGTITVDYVEWKDFVKDKIDRGVLHPHIAQAAKESLKKIVGKISSNKYGL